MHRNPSRVVRGLAACVLFAVSSLAWSAEQGVDAAQQMQRSIDDIGQQTQQRINQLSEKAREMLSKYRAARNEIENLRIYTDQLAREVESQQQKIASLKAQLQQIGETKRAFVPSMLRALDALAKFIKHDLPFRMEQRLDRIADLRELMGSADASIAEKYRRLMEAYMAEMEYGRTIGTYRGTLEIGGEKRSARFLRVGRIVLMYQTLNQERTGRWNPARDQWQTVGEAYRAAFERAYQIAAQQAPPDLLRLPVSTQGDN